ncbi:MAG: ATP-grasp domain-containing protein [Candidatus Omnitrophota bacterium]
MKIALTYNLKEKDSSKPPDYFSEFDSQETINAVINALQLKGHEAEAVNVCGTDIFDYFKKNKIDIVFNMAEGKAGRLRESEIPAILDYLDVPYTGSNTFSLALALNKGLTKKILKADNIPTPNFQLFVKGTENLNPELKFPLIVKPNCEGSAKGINKTNVVESKEGLFEKIKELKSVYKQDVLAEEFIEGKELTVGVLGNSNITVLPILEIDFSECVKSGEYFYSWRMKEFQGNSDLGLNPAFHCPARLDKETEILVKQTALKTHHAIGCLDISRTDIRLDKNNIPYVLEINPLPGLDPKESNLPIMAYAAGMKFEDLINSILTTAYERSFSKKKIKVA